MRATSLLAATCWAPWLLAGCSADGGHDDVTDAAVGHDTAPTASSDAGGGDGVDDGNGGDGGQGAQKPEFPGFLLNLGVAVTPLAAAKGQAGDLVLSTETPAPLGPFGGPDPEGAGVRPNLGFRCKKGTVVRAPLDAVVQNKLWQAGYGDWELHLVPSAPVDGKWLVILDHVDELNVAKGDKVTAGAVLGTAKDWGPKHALVELHILREPSKPGELALHLCPLSVLEESVASGLMVAMQAVVDAMAQPPWRFGEGSRAYVLPGCVCTTIPEQPGRAKPTLACADAS